MCSHRDLCLVFSTLFFFLSSISFRLAFRSTDLLLLLLRLRLLDLVLLLLLFVKAGLEYKKENYSYFGTFNWINGSLQALFWCSKQNYTSSKFLPTQHRNLLSLYFRTSSGWGIARRTAWRWRRTRTWTSSGTRTARRAGSTRRLGRRTWRTVTRWKSDCYMFDLTYKFTL